MNGTPTVLGVLLCDDNATWAQLVKQMIERRLPESNRKVRWEASIPAGILALEEFHADVVLLDLDFPDSRPYETRDIISKFPEPVYVLSDHFDKNNPTASTMAMDCMRAGAYRVYNKDVETVEWLIGELVQSHIRLTLNGTRK